MTQNVLGFNGYEERAKAPKGPHQPIVIYLVNPRLREQRLEGEVVLSPFKIELESPNVGLEVNSA